MKDYREYMQAHLLTEQDLPPLIRQMIEYHERFQLACKSCTAEEQALQRSKNQLAEQAILSALLDHFDEAELHLDEHPAQLEVLWQEGKRFLGQSEAKELGIPVDRRVIERGDFLLTRKPFQKFFHIEKVPVKSP